jgi:hypothetical protein
MADALESLESRPDTEDGWNGAPGGAAEGNGNEYPGNDGNPGHGMAASGSGDTAAAEEEPGGTVGGKIPAHGKSFRVFPETEDDIRNLAGLLRFLASRCSGRAQSVPVIQFPQRTEREMDLRSIPLRARGRCVFRNPGILIPEGARQADTVSADVLCEDEDGKRGRYAFAFRREGGGYNLSFPRRMAEMEAYCPGI